jgi:hypothetical protein
LSIALLALQKESKFQKQYDIGMKKGEYWEYALEDALDIAARIPVVAAKIYRRTFFDGVVPSTMLILIGLATMRTCLASMMARHSRK